MFKGFSFNKNILLFILFIFLTVFSFKSFLVSGYFPMHDDLQVSRLYQMDLCVKDGQIPCRWVPDMGYGYGYPLFNFYPPFPYYLGEAFHLVGFSFIDSVKFLFIVSLLFSGLFAYLFGKELWGKYGGFVSAIFYVFAPYHAVDVYVRGAMNEFFALVFFPAIFWVSLKLIKEEKPIYIVLFSLFTALLLLSHNLMAFFIAPAIMLFCLFAVWYFKKPWKVLLKIMLAGLWGIGLAAFFTLPVIFEQKFVHIETMFIGYFNYLAHFADLNQLFISRFWGFGASVWGDGDGMPFPLGQAHWILALLSFLVFLYYFIKGKKKEFIFGFLFLILFLGYAFLAHQRSVFLWQIFTFLSFAQFPWRFIGPSVFFASFLAGGFLIFIKSEKIAFSFTLFLACLVILLNFSYFKPEKILDISDSDKLFSFKNWNKLQTDAIFDYLPIYAQMPPAEKAPDKPWLEKGEGKITNFQKGTNWQKFDLLVDSGQGVVRLPLYDFPGMEVFLDDKRVTINHDNYLGLITFEVVKGDYQVKTKLEDTLIRKTGNLISLVSWIGFFGYLLVVKYRHGRNGQRNRSSNR